MNRLDPKVRAQIITALIEGNSVASTCRIGSVWTWTAIDADCKLNEAEERADRVARRDRRMIGVAKMTVLSLIREKSGQRARVSTMRRFATSDIRPDLIALHALG